MQQEGGFCEFCSDLSLFLIFRYNYGTQVLRYGEF